MLNKRVLRPIEYPYLIRLGNNKDGGYVVPEPQVYSSSYLISLGISDDWSFEQAFLKKILEFVSWAMITQSDLGS